MTAADPPSAPPLKLPDPSELSTDQLCGRACLWCHMTLDNVTAVDLGAREVDAHGTTTRWYPRCCPSCHYTHMYTEFQEHVKSCKRCSTSLPFCIQGQRLYGGAMRVSTPGQRR